jgi:hypothetical protein
MKIGITIMFYLFIFSFESFSQDTIGKKINKDKFQCSIKAGGCYKSFWGNKYIAPTPNLAFDTTLTHQFDGFKKIPTHSFNVGILFSYKIYNNWHIASGLFYFVRRDVYESNPDTVNKYHTSVYVPISGITRYDYFSENIELPLLVLYKYKKINFLAGVHLPIVTFLRTTYTYADNLSPQYATWGTSQKVINTVETSLTVFPTFQISYDLKIKNLSLNPFLGIDFGVKKSFYLQGGIILPLIKQNNN